MADLGFDTLRVANVARCEQVFHKLTDWSETDWGCALAGEVGELCNLLKKRRRLVGNSTVPLPFSNAEDEFKLYGRSAAKEMADVVIYLDLLAARMGIDLGEAVRAKFNEVSRRRGSTVFLPEVTDGGDDQE